MFRNRQNWECLSLPFLWAKYRIGRDFMAVWWSQMNKFAIIIGNHFLQILRNLKIKLIKNNDLKNNLSQNTRKSILKKLQIKGIFDTSRKSISLLILQPVNALTFE